MPRKNPITVEVTDKFQKKYTYELVEPIGRNFDVDFQPDLTPKQMLALGIFGGKYMTDCKKEYPENWFTKAKLSPKKHNDTLNYFHIHASQSLGVWLEKGWINEKHDPRGWFQWYCRYYMGRRLQVEDDRQIKRWKAMKRHVAQIRKNCKKGDLACRTKQRQALLHWGYNSLEM
ncbi:hypothetical protein COY25_00445 [Candidatus Uhrbacteria bacterium CG_4_10_14_0_2_um_filter_41_7]|uniref:Uncharacterized protein n=1 Tax=Candidatus Uhrbacteria bacterium CG_4_9_14_3_um_filter_41_35 TaxID=1975034 RepID=A0A2M7XF19_9BACT|nr:MAG: hypothetical protein COV92_03105 [Candidatus Uhrbacteria bacterium CG11_big_fil_rev_8_21_14_0_20_41_9]PIZ55668.1 MAG: hypothetical protein COY25_00445 [Candidatus Uhrbacteria bacterium CG_4_10_14_0_2_um_filter_41_7]PJA46479.1 MAG: hypothetical protein CO173_01810 [Candidatus Uhrbacteria bacterium CG_4_9_14_3_um_filter_41_35]